MDRILELATTLGKSISDDPRAKNFAEARDALEKSLEDRQLLADYEQQQNKVRTLEAQGQPVEPEEKRTLAELHTKLAGSEVIRALASAQADYVELMSQVSIRIEQEALGTPEGDHNEAQ